MGMDAKSSNFLSLKAIYDKPVVFLFLNNDLRVRTSLTNISERTGVSDDKIWVFNSYDFRSCCTCTEYTIVASVWLPLNLWSQLHQFVTESQIEANRLDSYTICT